MLKIKEIRESKSLTQDDMVRLTGIPKRSYVDYENGKSDIQLSKLQKIATVLNVAIGEILGETKSKNFLTVDNGKENGKENGEKPKVEKVVPSNNMSSESKAAYSEVLKKLKYTEGLELSDDGAPFYSLPVSAGKVAELIEMQEVPTGYINLPGIHCDAYFPITGASFEPYIKAGDIIGINFIDTWQNLDPDCIYLIITYDQRMIKRLMHHPEDSTLLICISPNYKEFTIDKFTIRYIHKVTFYGRPV